MLASLVGLALFADAENYAATFDASNRTEMRVRYTQHDALSPALDLLDIASARLTLSDRRWEHYISYTPVLTAPYLFRNSPPLLLHAATIGTAWHNRRVRIELTEDGNYGQENSTLLSNTVAGGTAATPTVPGAQVAAAPVTLTFAFWRSTLTSQIELDRRTRLTMGVSYLIQSGLDDPSRYYFPLQKGPRAEVVLGESATRIDVLETHLIGQLSDSTKGVCPVVATAGVQETGCDPAVQFAIGLEAWRHRFSATIQGSLGVGVSYSRTRLHDTDSYNWNVLPVAEAWIERTEGLLDKQRSVRLEGSLEPVVDVRSGAADYRAQLGLTGTVPYYDNLIRLQAWGIQTVKAVILPPLTLMRAEADIDHIITPWFSCGGGVRVEWEHEDPIGSFYTLLAFGQATFRVPSVHF